MTEKAEFKVTMSAYVGDKVYLDQETVAKIVGEYMRRLERARTKGANLYWGPARARKRWAGGYQ
ncbi:MAG: hypothetical protein AB4352_21220 [Hormoscilla sp.]